MTWFLTPDKTRSLITRREAETLPNLQTLGFHRWIQPIIRSGSHYALMNYSSLHKWLINDHLLIGEVHGRAELQEQICEFLRM